MKSLPKKFGKKEQKSHKSHGFLYIVFSTSKGQKWDSFSWQKVYLHHYIKKNVLDEENQDLYVPKDFKLNLKSS